MTDPGTRERRPLSEPPPRHTTETSLPSADADRTQARCKRCHAPLSRPESVAAELGPVCRHAIDLEGVAEHGDAL